VKNRAHQELLNTIRSVHRGSEVVSPEVSSDLAADATDDTPTSPESGDVHDSRHSKHQPDRE
jgi:hypothetical protein